jgi:hypothetical protein
MLSATLRVFDRQFQEVVAPTLAARAFNLDDEQVFRRVVEHDATRSTQIIEFQVGQEGWSIGRFTVNLAVFNRDYLPPSWPIPDGEPQPPECLSDLVQRLGFFRTPRRGMIDRILGRRERPRDYWWRQYNDPRVMRKEFAEVMNILLNVGLHWLDTRTSVTAFRWALRQLERRKEWKTALGSPGAARLFADEPFPLD